MNYKSRRQKIFQKVPTNSIMVFSGEKEKVRNNDVHFDFRQNSSFHYLSGCNEPNVKMILMKVKGKNKHILFKKIQTDLDKVWNNHTTPFDEEKSVGQWDEVLDISSYETYLDSISTKLRNVYLDLSDIETIGLLNRISAGKIKSITSIGMLIEEERQIKELIEIKQMRNALTITGEAIIAVLKSISKKGNESEINAEIDYIFSKNSVEKAYQTIVAAGNNGNILHYTNNNAKIEKDSLVLIDVGCEYKMYASDITRTLPSSGKFTEPQKELYTAVLDVQKTLIKKVRPNTTFSELNSTYIKLITQKMVDLGILSGNIEKLIKEKMYKVHSPHSVGHWLGMDVHDRNPYEDIEGKPMRFKEGMVLTIEPGIYLNMEDVRIPEKYRGMAIRIEDDIMVTSNGHEVLSKHIPKEIEDIERLSK